MTKRLHIPEDLEGWWADSDPEASYNVDLVWRGGLTIRVGQLKTNPELFRFAPLLQEGGPKVAKLGDVFWGADRPERALAMPLVRAGWRYPRLDPTLMRRLVRMRQQQERRFEFILDTQAFVEGVAHWLVAIFADCCDLVVTDVTLRELQDLASGARLSSPLGNVSKPSDVCGRRHSYLAATRFREFAGFKRTIWRELTLEDTALLMSRGHHGGAKNAESDTAILRAVRRSINNQIQGLERFFVTGDTDLARRAATELPHGSIIRSYVPELETNAVYSPCKWWPGDDSGAGFHHGTAMRLVWELLAIGDRVRLCCTDGPRVFEFCSFEDPMWPSDYVDPWVTVDTSGVSNPAATSSNSDPKPAGAAQGPSLSDKLVPSPPTFNEVPTLTANVRFGVNRLVTMLADIGRTDPEAAVIECRPGFAELSNSTRRKLSRLVDGLGFGTFLEGGRTFELGPSAHYLRDVWAARDVDALAALLRRYEPLDKIIDNPNRSQSGVAQSTRKSCVRLGKYLDQLVEVSGRLYSGSANPAMGDIRSALRTFLERREADSDELHAAASVYQVFVEVFIKQLSVSPQRANRRFDRMSTAGVFEGIELRTGGSSSTATSLDALEIGDFGFRVQRFDIETLSTYRDLLLRN